jgi:hypothetical protein
MKSIIYIVTFLYTAAGCWLERSILDRTIAYICKGNGPEPGAQSPGPGAEARAGPGFVQ